MLALSRFLSRLQIRQYLTAGGYTSLAYDYLLTFDLEVDYIWHAPWNPVKAIFLLNRYGTLIGYSFLLLEEVGIMSHGSRKFCAKYLWFQSLLIFISSETTRTLLLLRAWALWKCSYHVAVSLVSIYVFWVLMQCIYSAYLLFKHDACFDYPYLDETGVCVISATVASVWLTSFISILLDSGMSAVIAYYLYRLCRGTQHLQHSPLLRLLVRDAILFYMVNIFYNVLGILTLSVFADDPLYFVQIAVSFPMLVVAGQRVVLNLRGLQAKHYSTGAINGTIDRQLTALRRRSFWQTMDIWMNDLHQELELNEERTRRGTARSTGRHFTEGRGWTQDRGLYELEVIRTPVGSRRASVALHYDRTTYDPLVHHSQRRHHPYRRFEETEQLRKSLSSSSVI